MNTTTLPAAHAGPAPAKAVTSWEFWGRILVLPYLVVFVVFVLYPVGYGLWLARSLKPRWSVAPQLKAPDALWNRSFTHLYALPINWNSQIHGVNQKAWSKLDPKVQSFLQTNIRAMIDNMWDAANTQTQQGYDCNTGAAACPLSPAACARVKTVTT